LKLNNFQQQENKIKMLQINIYGQANENLTIDIDPDENVFKNTSILQLKKKFIEKKCLPAEPENIRLIFAGKPLEDTRKFSDYGIQNNSTVMYVVRLPGGV